MRLVLSIAFLTITFGCGSNVEKLEADATEFGRMAGWDVTGASCQKYDSDNNGYVSCTVFTTQGPQPLECASDYTANGCAGGNGCRVVFLHGTVPLRKGY